MDVIATNMEARLVEQVRTLKGEAGGHYALHFHLSGLQDHYRSDFQIRIAVNILNDIFRDEGGGIFVARDADVFVLYAGEDKNLLQKAVFQLRYLFVDDPLANHEDGTENEQFCTNYDLAFQWRAFYRLAMDRFDLAAGTEVAGRRGGIEEITIQEPEGLLTPRRLQQIKEALPGIDLSYALRRQPISAVQRSGHIRPVFHELYVNMAQLRRILDDPCDLTSDRALFTYLTALLDEKVLALLADRPRHYLQEPVSLNLNVRTILSDVFDQFAELLPRKPRPSIVIELDIADIFADMPAFIVAREIAHQQGFRICLDGLTDDSFVQISRHRLGFDLAKLRWNADMKESLSSSENRQLANAIEECGSNRMILCRCDSDAAIEYGRALGISLFQGRYPDRMIDPENTVVN